VVPHGPVEPAVGFPLALSPEPPPQAATPSSDIEARTAPTARLREYPDCVRIVVLLGEAICESALILAR
jgi:hypothetical protein